MSTIIPETVRGKLKMLDSLAHGAKLQEQTYLAAGDETAAAEARAKYFKYLDAWHETLRPISEAAIADFEAKAAKREGGAA